MEKVESTTLGQLLSDPEDQEDYIDPQPACYAECDDEYCPYTH
jgi:hypothetical protein